MPPLTGVAARGDSLWTLTSRTLSVYLGRRPTNEEISAAILTAQVPSGDFSDIEIGDTIVYGLEQPTPETAAAMAPPVAPVQAAAPVSVQAYMSPPAPASASPTMGAAKQKMVNADQAGTARNLTDFMSL